MYVSWFHWGGFLLWLGVLSPKEDERLCNKYEGCIFPLHECLSGHELMSTSLIIYLNYLKNKLVAFWEGLGFADGVRSSVVVSKKHKKWYIEMHLLVETSTKQKMHDIFGEGVEDLFLFVPLFQSECLYSLFSFCLKIRWITIKWCFK